MYRHFLVLAIFGFSVLSARAEEKVVLRPHWEPGKVYHFEATFEVAPQKDSCPDDQFSVLVIMHVDFLARKEPKTDRKLVDMKISALKAIMDDGDEITTFDSANPAASDPDMQEEFGELVGATFPFVYDQADKYVEALAPKDFKSPGADFGGKEMAEILRDELALVPPKDELALTESFAMEDIPGNTIAGSTVVATKGRFESVINHEGRKHARIVMESEVSLTPREDAAQRQESSMHSEILFDLERKMVSRRTATSLPQGSSALEGMKETRVITLKGVEDAPLEKK